MASIVLCGVTLSVTVNRSLVLVSPPHLIFRFVHCSAHCINFVIGIDIHRKRAECIEFGIYHYKNYGSRKSFSESCEFLFMWRRKKKKEEVYQNRSDDLTQKIITKTAGTDFHMALVQKIHVPVEA